MRIAAVWMTVLVLLFAVGPVAADDEAAGFFVERGKKALADGDWREAATSFEKALAEKKDCLPAILGLAKVAEKEAKKDDAIRHAEHLLDLVEEQDAPDGDGAAEEARALLRRVDRFRLEYRLMVGLYVAKLLDLAGRHVKSDAALARRCIEKVLEFRPEHPKALKLRDELPAPASKPFVKPGETPLLNGRDFRNWSSKGPPTFSVRGGILVVTAGATACQARSEDLLAGDYNLEFEARLAEETGRESMIALGFGHRGTFDLWRVEVFESRFHLIRLKGTEKDLERIGSVEIARMAKPLDRKAWNLFRVEVRGEVMRFYANGECAFEYTALSRRAYEGSAYVAVQGCTAEFRRISKVP